MHLEKGFLLIVFLPVSISEYCSEPDSLFDKGLAKVLRSERFSEIILPNFWHNVDDLLGLKVGFFDGKLRGFRSIRKNGRSVLNVDDSGSRLTFHIVGGPLVARYSVGLRTGYLRNTFDIGAQVRSLHCSFIVQESSPNELQLEVHGVRMSRITLLLDESDELSLSGVIYDIVFDQLRPLIEQKIGRLLAQELRKLAQETIGAVKVYATTGTSQNTREQGIESGASLTWRKAIGSARSYLTLINSNNREGATSVGLYNGRRHPRRPPRRMFEPLLGGLERQRDIFDNCLRTLVVSTGFDPMPLPNDLEEFAASVGRVTVIEGNVTGLSSIRRTGKSSMTLDDCGLQAQFSLGCKGLTVTAAASVTNFLMSTNVVLEMQIPEVEARLEIKENNTGLHVVAYELNFTAPVTVTPRPLGTVGTVVNFFGGVSEVTLGEEELEQLRMSSWKYVQKIAFAIQEFIADPPLLPTR